MKTEIDTTIAGIKSCLCSGPHEQTCLRRALPFPGGAPRRPGPGRKFSQAASPSTSLPRMVQTKWAEGFPLLKRWDFPLDVEAAATILALVEDHLCRPSNEDLRKAHAALKEGLAHHSEQQAAFWQSFLQHDWEPWEEWVQTGGHRPCIPSLSGSKLPASVPGASCRRPYPALPPP